MSPLCEEHEAEVREIARQEVRRFAAQLVDEIAAIPSDVDVSPLDLYRAISEAVKRYDAGEPA